MKVQFAKGEILLQKLVWVDRVIKDIQERMNTHKLLPLTYPTLLEKLKKVQETTSSNQDGSLTTIQCMNAYQWESPFRECTRTYCSLDTLYNVRINVANKFLRKLINVFHV